MKLSHFVPAQPTSCRGRNKAALSPLVVYALRGLDNCWLDRHQRWSHAYHLDGRSEPNVSLPASDVFYTLNVLLGLGRLDSALGIPHDYLYDTFERNVLLLPRLHGPTYALGMALWTAAELEMPLPVEVARHIRATLDDKRSWDGFTAQDLGMILTGVCAQARSQPAEFSDLAHALFTFLDRNFTTSSGLFRNAKSSLRRNYASFAAITYLTMACYIYGRQFSIQRAIELGHACTRAIIALQGPQGEWPWMLDAARGEVIDFYEVYSVHQDGMAPAFLELAEINGFGPDAKAALIKGFNWIYGQNQLNASMLVPELGLIARSHVRRGELTSKAPRALRAVANSALSRPGALVDPRGLVVRKECRSYHLGWIIWSFSQRCDLTELTHHPLLTA